MSLTPNQMLVLGQVIYSRANTGHPYLPTSDERRTVSRLVRRGLIQLAAHPNPRAAYSPPRYDPTEAGSALMSLAHAAVAAAEARFAKSFVGVRRRR